MHAELLTFAEGFARSVGRMFGHSAIGPIFGSRGDGYNAEPNVEYLRESPLWRTLDAMYDYGVLGKRTDEVRDLGGKSSVDGSFADVELFLRGLDGLEMYFEEDDYRLPKLCRQTVRLAVARCVLDGGDRYTDYEDAPPFSLSFAELALLADMDERSVRNAANPKVPDALKPETVGKRSVVPIEEARRWLAGRKGFVPTTDAGGAEVEMVSLFLPAEVVKQITAQASASGYTVPGYIRAHLAGQ